MHFFFPPYPHSHRMDANSQTAESQTTVGEQLPWSAPASNHRAACGCAGVIAEVPFC